MIFSYNTAFSNFTLSNGFGRAGWGIINSLKQLGHEVYFNAPQAPVELTFAQPDYFELNDTQHQIILTPWESTKLRPGWLENFELADEVWATSDWVADVYRKEGVQNVTTVYPHGIEKIYKPKLKHRGTGPMNFYVQGAPANRKGTQMAFDAFREVFKDNGSKATLTIKAFGRHNVRWRDSDGIMRNPADLPNIQVETQELELPQMVEFTNSFHANIYPSYGEGWGFIPMESLAQGTPTICTASWCHYRDYLGDLGVKSKLIDSPWEDEHPGQVYEPDFDDLCDKIRLVYDDYENQSRQAFKAGLKMHKEYNWLSLTEKAFAHVVENPNFS